MTGILTVSLTWCLLFDICYTWGVLAVKIQNRELNWHIHVCILLWWHTIKVWNQKRKKNFPYLLPPCYLLGMPYLASCDFIPLCNMEWPGKSVFLFSMELSAQQKKQVYHVCRDGKKWRENHDQALVFSFAFAIINSLDILQMRTVTTFRYFERQ